MERLTITSTALGMEQRESGWFFRLRSPGPEYDWVGPFDSQYAAHATAVRKLLFFAQLGQQSLDSTLNDDTLKLADVWRRAFE